MWCVYNISQHRRAWGSEISSILTDCQSFLVSTECEIQDGANTALQATEHRHEKCRQNFSWKTSNGKTNWEDVGWIEEVQDTCRLGNELQAVSQCVHSRDILEGAAQTVPHLMDVVPLLLGDWGTNIIGCHLCFIKQPLEHEEGG